MITSPEMFERYLPFAMAFKVDEPWARAFDDLYTSPPSWYRSGSGAAFRASSFTQGLNRMASQAGQTMSSSPSGSGGSGGGSGEGGGADGLSDARGRCSDRPVSLPLARARRSQ